jgi:hypothetical protein
MTVICGFHAIAAWGKNCDVNVIKVNGLVEHPFSFALSPTRLYLRLEFQKINAQQTQVFQV